ncbi:12765_t:CDS:2 [Cetraspora pellucida]|uniref:12765_t:CDS:1 n=1 Tax=Cetraspora pellucida TaxID=1433469 RepID=A0ACA9JVX7_9GLOM|nr:12765_t:CDS:2 [Cetraspora pellucida]
MKSKRVKTPKKSETDDSSSKNISASSSGNVYKSAEVKRKQVDECSELSNKSKTTKISSTPKRRKTSRPELYQLQYPVNFNFNEFVKEIKSKNNELRDLFIRNNLINTKGEFTFQKPKLVNLSRLSDNNFQDRFNINKDKLPFICRKNCIEIFDRVMDSIDEKTGPKGLYIHSPSGSGKSYSLYYLVAQLHLIDNYRITYINSCDDQESEIAYQHEKFRATLTNMRKSNLNKCIATMILEANKTSNVNYGLNRQFMYEVEFLILDDEGNVINTFKTYAAIHLLAKMAIRNSFDNEDFEIFINDVQSIASLIFEGDFTHDVKGRVIKLYITTLLES